MASHVTPAGAREPVPAHIDRLRRLLAEVLTDREAESGPVGPALTGRTAAAPVNAPIALPSFDNSQMDGFAVRRQDLREGASALPLAFAVPAGTAAPALPEEAAAAVMTGSAIPDGADLVVPVERSRDGFAHLDSAGSPGLMVHFPDLQPADLTPGRFIRPAGSDVRAGQRLLHPGDLLTPGRIGALAGCGIAEVSVWEQVRTLVVSTGAEIRPAGAALGPGEIYDANAPMIAAVCAGWGHRTTTAQLATDDPTAFLTAFDSLVAEHRPHLVVTAGGVSAGAYEVVRQSLAQRGVSFTAVAQQPGGPQGAGRLETPPGTPSPAVVALPGNPVSAAVSLQTLLRPALAELDPACPAPLRIQARTAEDVDSPAGLRQYRRVRLTETPDDGAPRAELVGGPGSHLLAHLAAADALLELTEDDTRVPAGSLRPAIVL